MAEKQPSVICLCHCTRNHANRLGEAIEARTGKRHLRLEGFAEAYAIAHPVEQMTVATELSKYGWNAVTAKEHSVAYQQAVDRAWIQSKENYGESWPLEVAQAVLNPTHPIPMGMPTPVTNLICHVPEKGLVVSDQLNTTGYLPWLRSHGALIVHQQEQYCVQATQDDHQVSFSRSGRGYRDASESVLQSLTTKLHS
ncbi:hypothetical protein ACTXJX_11875 [Glutamicibacter ardleyensis]|uniref:hypothetical protein n=1 Tax=Glutamicibacter ardleyensis TaxID=225894 RepID=UPI003FD0C756